MILKKPIEEIETIINYQFKNKKNLVYSLVHPSFYKGKKKLIKNVNQFERLEFLGDRVLGLIISKKLLEIFPNDKEGILDKKLASLVNRKKCFEISKKFNLDKYLITGNVKSKRNILADKIMSDACEALIGAIYLDQGFNIVEKFIIKFWKNHMNMNIADQIDAKTKLQEYSLKKYKVLPKYKLFSNTGPQHKPTFKIGVSLQNSKTFYARGNSKKDAEQKAAKLLLKQFGL